MKNLLKSIFLFYAMTHLFLGFSQEEKNLSDDIYFMIGLLNDYGGKSYVPTHPKEQYFITDFYESQGKSLDAFIQKIEDSWMELSDFEIIKDNSEFPITKIYSRKYSAVFNEFYKYKRSNIPYYEDDSDTEYNLYWGKLRRCKFKTLGQKLSFLKGSFVRNGSKTNNQFEFRFSNSFSKEKLVVKLLKQTKSEIINIKTNEKTTPNSTVILFKPSKNFEKTSLEN